MIRPDFELTKGNRLPILERKITGNGKPIPFPSGTTVHFKMWLEGQFHTPKVDTVANFISQNLGLDETTPTVVSHEWGEGDVDTEGVYFARWVFTFPSGETMDVPNAKDEHMIIRISEPD